MVYIGDTPRTTSFASVVKDAFSGDGSTDAFTLSKIATTNSVSVFVENVRQEPTTAYSVSGTTLTFTAAPVTSSGNNIYVLHMNPTATATHPSAQNLTAVDGTFTGTVTAGSTLDMNGTELILDADADTSITADTDDQIDIRVAGSDKIQIDTTKVEIKGATDNSQGGAFPRIQISTVADNNPTYSGALDIVEKQTSASGTAVFGNNGLYGFRMMLDGYNNILKWFSGNQTTVTERMGLARETGNLTLNTGNLVIGTSGKGIDFSATGGPTQGSGTSELLDDYEEGTWTPTLLGSSSHPSITTSVAAGKFVRIGSLVHIQWNMIITNVASSGSGNAQVGGIPFAHVCNTYQGYIGIMYNDVWSNETQKGYIPNGQSYIQLAPTGRTQSNLGVGTVSTGYFGGGGSYTIV